jgi:hypothetical protein
MIKIEDTNAYNRITGQLDSTCPGTLTREEIVLWQSPCYAVPTVKIEATSRDLTTWIRIGEEIQIKEFMNNRSAQSLLIKD